jgi:hypothetical protein
LCKEPFNAIEALVPESVVCMQPTHNFAQWFSLKFYDVVSALPHAPDKASVLKHFEMLGHSV